MKDLKIKEVREHENSTYVDRMLEEYYELLTEVENLAIYIHKVQYNQAPFDGSVSIDLLECQLEKMKEYASILLERLCAVGAFNDKGSK